MTSPTVARWWSLADKIAPDNQQWLKVSINDNTATCTVESCNSSFEVVKCNDGSATVTIESISSMYGILTELFDQIDDLVVNHIVNANQGNVCEEMACYINALNSKLEAIDQAVTEVLLYRASENVFQGPFVLENGLGSHMVDTLLQALMPPAISEILGVVVDNEENVIEVDALLQDLMMPN